jgi:predicted permease
VALFRNVRLACRALARAPGFSFTVVAVLGLSIGALTTVFSAIDVLLFRQPGNVPTAGRVAWLTSISRERSRPEGLSYDEFAELQRGQAAAVTAVAAYDAPELSLATEQDALRLRGQVVAGDYFRILGAEPSLGRPFTSQELAPGAGQLVAILGYGLWRDRFGADPGVVGRSLTIDGKPFQVVGIGKPGFRGPELGAEADVWLPMGAADEAIPSMAESLRRPSDRFLRVLVRVADGVSLEAAQASLQGVERGIAETRGDNLSDRSFGLTPVAGGIAPDGRQETQWSAGLFAVIALLVVLIACFNVANLLLARAAQRRQDSALRLALGASRWHLVQHVLMESGVLAVAGGVVGLMLALASIRVLDATWPAVELLGLNLDPRATLFLLGATCGTGLLFGLVPAWQSARGLSTEVRRGTGDRRLRRLQKTFIVGQLGTCRGPRRRGAAERDHGHERSYPRWPNRRQSGNGGDGVGDTHVLRGASDPPDNRSWPRGK